MDSHDSDVVDRIARYQSDGRIADDNPMEVNDKSTQELESHLDALIQQFEARFKAQKEELEQLQMRTVPLNSIMLPSADPRDRLKQFQTLKVAYDSVTVSKPELPDPKSIIPKLIAFKHLNDNITNACKAVESNVDKLEWAQKQAKDEENRLADMNLLADALLKRTSLLEIREDERSLMPPAEASRKLLESRAMRKNHFEDETQRLRKALTGFIRTRLGAMVAGEEIGGPVVGDLSEISEDMLVAGFSTQGKQKSATAKPISKAKRQRRIDEIWGLGVGASDGQAISEEEAAIVETTRLIEALLEVADSNAGSYLDLERDSAAARFLVRAKVAQFHPKDARKIRLLDFGRELND